MGRDDDNPDLQMHDGAGTPRAPDGSGSSVAGKSGLLRLADHRQPDPARILSELADYWRSLRHGRAIPERADIEPRGIRNALDYAFILERIAPGAARFRLTGRHLLDLMGMEVRGMPLCSVIEPQARGRFSDIVETVFRAPQIAELALHSAAGYGRPALDGRMLLLPLRSDLGDVTRALGCLITTGETGRAPRRFDITAEWLEPVIDGAQIVPPTPSATNTADNARIPPVRVPAQRSGDPGLDAERSLGQRAGTALAPSAPAPVTTQPATPEARRAMFRVISCDNVDGPNPAAGK